MNIKEIKQSIKGVFKLPVKSYYFGKIEHGCPYFYPWNFNKTILTIRKERPMFLRCKYFKLFNREISYGWPIKVVKYDLGWKDKFNSPRFEWSPSFQIYFFKWQFCMWWVTPIEDRNNDNYWEQILWYLHYSDKDVNKARDTWGWVDHYTKLSTWKDKYLEGTC
jgi:hypothetical protein